MKNLMTARSFSIRTDRPRIRGTKFARVIVAISTAVVITSCNVKNTLPLSDIPIDIENHVGIPVVDKANVEGLVFFLDRSEGVLHVPDQERLAKFIGEGALEPIQWTPGSSTAVITFAAGSVPERQTVRVQATRRTDLFAFPAACSCGKISA